MTHPDPNVPPPGIARRTVQRILLEAAALGVLGAMVLGLCWEVGMPDVGWVLAILVWTIGPASLEIGRALNQRT